MCWWCGTCRPNGEIREGDFGGEGKLLIEYRRDWVPKQEWPLPPKSISLPKNWPLWWPQSDPHWTANLFQPEPPPADFEYE